MSLDLHTLAKSLSCILFFLLMAPNNQFTVDNSERLATQFPRMKRNGGAGTAYFKNLSI